MINRRTGLVSVIGAVLALPLLACASIPRAGEQATDAKMEPRYGGLVRIASPWTPTDLDIHGRSNNGNFRRFVWQGLLEHERNEPLHDFRINYSLVPSLAERWEQPNPTTYLFYLRRGVRWHDGPEFTAKDVVFTFEHILDPKNKYVTDRKSVV